MDRVFEKSLLEIFNMARDDREEAIHAAERLIVPLNRERYYEHNVRGNYYGFYGHPYELEVMPEAGFDFESREFFKKHSHGQFSPDGRNGTILPDQPDEGLTSIVLGRVPTSRVEGHLSVYWKDTREDFDYRTGSHLLYLYAESGTVREPNVSPLIMERRPISEDQPIMYASFPFSEVVLAATEKVFSHRIEFIIPRGHLPRQYGRR